jgi:hypothetical protein
VFCSFLALVLRKELDDRYHTSDFRPEWADVLRDLDRLQEVDLAKNGERLILRTPSTGTAGRLFQAARIDLSGQHPRRRSRRLRPTPPSPNVVLRR